MAENKLIRTALTEISWYDYIGTNYEFKDFLDTMKKCDQVAERYSDMYTIYLVDDDTPNGKTYSKYYYHKELCDKILRGYNIDDDENPYSFILQSHFLIYEGYERKALTEMYEKDVSKSIVRYLKQHWE